MTDPKTVALGGPASKDEMALALRIVNAMPVPVAYLDAGLTIRMASRAAAEGVGLSSEELVGRNVVELFGDAPGIATVRDAVAAQSPASMLFRTHLEGDRERQWEIAIVPDVVDGEIAGAIAVAFDVTELTEAQERLAESERVYRSVGELLPFGTWIADGDGAITYLSDSFVKMTGRESESLLGWGWLDLVPSKQERDAARLEWHQVKDADFFRDTKHVIRARDGSLRYVLCRGVRLSPGAGAEGKWAGIHVDITASERQLQFRDALNTVKDMLVSSLETEELLAQVGEAVLSPVGADFTAVVSPLKGGCWEIRYASGEYGALHLGDRIPRDNMPLNTLALKTGEIQVSIDPLHDRRMNRERAREDGLKSLAVLPIKRSGSTICLLALAYTSTSMIADQPLMDFLCDLTDSLDLALQSANAHEHQRHIAVTLQESLLAIPDHLPRVEIAHLYQAAAENERVGGDFYDAFELRGKTAVLIGDISGSGIDAAALTALAKNTIRAHLVDNQSPADALTKANLVLHSFTEPHEFATVFVGVLDSRSGRLRYASAGHPPPMLVGERGAHAVEGGGLILGSFEDATYEDYTTNLLLDETLLLYTDGITEARSGAGLYGDTRFQAFLDSLDGIGSHALLEAVRNDACAFANGATEDDIAMLAVKPIGLVAHPAHR